MSMSFTTLTELRYPNLKGAVPLKWDYFYMEDETLIPPLWRKLSMDEKYDFLNESGYWVKGWTEITPEQDEFIEKTQIAGLQDEVVVTFSQQRA
jgi:hypothetical protein